MSEFERNAGAELNMSEFERNACAVLNLARSMELRAISQYMQHHYALEASFYPTLAKGVKKVALDEMRHAEMLAVRIRELNGVPVTAPDGPTDVLAAPYSVFLADKALETDTLTTYRGYIATLENMGDYASSQLVKKILVEEVCHQQYFRDVYEHIALLGDTYLASQAGAKNEPCAYVEFLRGRGNFPRR